MPSQRELALQMIAQYRTLDPSASAEIGTPERKLIDTFAQSLHDSQVDLDALSSALDIDSKYGAQLDRFLSIFGFARQKATFATGFATFSRTTPSNTDIRIPASTSVMAAAIENFNDVSSITFSTVYEGILPAGQLSVVVPIRANIAGDSGNVATNRINQVSGSTVYGITAVTNESPTQGGKNAETDEEYKVRFKNTVFRNLAGTEDQYMALAVSTAFSVRANVVGPQSHYREYIQVPPVADNASYNINNAGPSEAGNGSAGEYSTALSTIPFAKYLYKTEQPVFISNRDLTSVFYRQDVDFRFNTTDAERNRGDAYRLAQTGLGPAVADSPNQPSVTFTNVYTGANDDVTAVRPNDLVLMEFTYMSEASRNNLDLNITNAVDVYVDGGNEVLSSTVAVRPTTATAFVDNPNSKYHYENFRRAGEPEKRPLIGNVLMPMYWQPSLNVPDQIVVDNNTYLKGIHYWAVLDVSPLGGTIRARNGIEWSTKVKGAIDWQGIEIEPSDFAGKVITDTAGDPVGGMHIEINDYTFDKNIVDLQAALEGAKQVTTDVLAHKAKTRYFKLDVTIMYANGSSISDTNLQVSAALDSFLKSQYFGSVIQLSDLLQAIHSVPGVDNVRWSSDIPNSGDLVRVLECDAHGKPLAGVHVDRVQPGTADRPEIQTLFISGGLTTDMVTFIIDGDTYTFAAQNALSSIQTAVNTTFGPGVVTVIEEPRTTAGVRVPARSIRLTWASNGAQEAAVAYVESPTGGPYVIYSDFILRDDEQASLPTAMYEPPVGVADAVPGLIIRPRAQNTWIRGR